MLYFHVSVVVIAALGFIFSQLVGIYVLNDANEKSFKNHWTPFVLGMFLIVVFPAILLSGSLYYVDLVRT